jgi:putative sugar O-methyltransferase
MLKIRDEKMLKSLEPMFRGLKQGNAVYLPSCFWERLNHQNIEALDQHGYKNFKQTIARNYFTWLIGPTNNQFRYLIRHTKTTAWPSILKRIFVRDPSSKLNIGRQIVLSFFTRMLWKFAESIDTKGLLKSLEEPQEGNPFKIFYEGRLISQDLANSVLEYYSIREQFHPQKDDITKVCELGAGYGRNAFVFIQAFPNCKYTIVDIPPALYIAQRYLTSVFKDKRIFSFRNFENFNEVHEELQSADLSFLLPHQAELLPAKEMDLFINISSLHEMRMDQIKAYFRLINRITKGYFYSKQWLVSCNPYDNVTIRHSEYPVPSNWKEIYHRKAKVQDSFFEAMYAINSGKS